MNEGARRSFVRLPRERRIQDIERAARAAFSEKGYAATSIADIAAGAGIVEGTIYKYFENKRELLFKVLGRWYQDTIGVYMENLDSIAGVRNRLRFVIGQHMRALRDNPDLSWLMFYEVRGADDYFDSTLHILTREYSHVLVKVLREGIKAGEFRDDFPVALMRDMILGGIEHHMLPFFRGRGEVDVERVADALTGLVMAAAAVPAQNAAPLDQAIDRLDEIARRLTGLAGKRRPKGGDTP